MKEMRLGGVSDIAAAQAFARREERVLSKALTFRSAGQLYAIKTSGPGAALRGARVSLHHFMDGTVRVRYKGRILDTTAFGASRAPAQAEDEKTLDGRLDAIVAAIAVTGSRASARPGQHRP